VGVVVAVARVRGGGGGHRQHGGWAVVVHLGGEKPR
jgi:hypothetical protein